MGVRFAFCLGLFVGGACCAMSGTLEFFEPGVKFVAVAIGIRAVHATANAMVITSTFTYT